jgi:hypothetical protein
MSPRRWLLIAVLMGCFIAPARADEPALAGPATPAARQHFVQGNRLYRARKFDEAVAAYQAGVVLEPAPVFDFNLGQCYRQLGRPAHAIWHYERFLRNGRPGGELHELATDFVRQMRAELERAGLARPPAGVEAVLGVSQTPRALQPAPVATPSAQIAARGDAGAPWHSDALGWALLGGGAAGAGAAAVLRASASGVRTDANAVHDEARRAELHEAARTRHRASAVLAIGSAALVAAGAIKLVLHADERSRPRAVAWRLRVIGRGVAVLGRF